MASKYVWSVLAPAGLEISLTADKFRKSRDQSLPHDHDRPFTIHPVKSNWILHHMNFNMSEDF